MSLPHRRTLLHLAAGLVALPAVARIARAQVYPVRPVRMVAATSAGSAPDVIARLMGHWLSERLGQQFVIENRPGGSGNIGTQAVVRAAADGYTLLLVSIAHATNVSLYSKLDYDFLRDIAPVASIVRIPNILVVHPTVPTRTVSEFIAYAKGRPGKINMASPGNGSAPHLAGELFKIGAEVNLVHVPYRGATQAMTDLLSGQVEAMFASTASSVEHIRAGRLRALAITSVARWEKLPDIPTVSEFLPGFEMSYWAGIGAPRNSPAAIVETLNKQINAGLGDTKIQNRLAELGGIPSPMSPVEFGKFTAHETEKWGRVIRAAGIKAE